MRMPVTLPKRMRCVAWSLVSMISQSNTGKAADQRRRAAGNAVPLGKRETFLDRQAGLARKSLGKRLLVVAQRVERKVAVPDEGFVLQILSVEADENGRRRVGYGAGCDYSCAAFARGPVGGDDMNRTRKPRHRIAIGLRPYFVLLQHSGISLRRSAHRYIWPESMPHKQWRPASCRRIRLLRLCRAAFTSCRALPAGPMLPA